MNKVYFLTSNSGKVKSMRRLVEPFGIKVYKNNVPKDQPERKGSSLEEIAKFKILDNKNKVNSSFVVNDGGFYISARPGFPGPDVNHTLTTIGIEGLLEMTPKDNRNCFFKNVVAFWSPRLEEIDPKNPIRIFINELYGTIAMQPSKVENSNAWSDLWKIFVPKGQKLTLSDMNRKELDKYHESSNKPENNAFTLFADWFSKNKFKLFHQKNLF